MEFLGGHSDAGTPVLYPRDREENALCGVEVGIGHQLLHRLRPHGFSREGVGHCGIGHSAPLRVLTDSNSQRPNDLIESIGEIQEENEFRKRRNFNAQLQVKGK